MPWCDACDAYRAPTALTDEGRCGACGSEVDTADLKHPPSAKAPWHFWVMIVALVIYLGWRLIQFGVYLIGRV